MPANANQGCAKRARQLSNDDLVAVLLMRQNAEEEESSASEAAAGGAASELSDGAREVASEIAEKS